MIPWKYLFVALLILVGAGPALMMIDRYLGRGAPAPEDYYREMTSMGRYGGVRCGSSDDDTAQWTGGLGHIYPGAGGDMVITGAGASFITFDYDSPRTGDEHDVL